MLCIFKENSHSQNQVNWSFLSPKSTLEILTFNSLEFSEIVPDIRRGNVAKGNFWIFKEIVFLRLGCFISPDSFSVRTAVH